MKCLSCIDGVVTDTPVVYVCGRVWYLFWFGGCSYPLIITVAPVVYTCGRVRDEGSTKKKYSSKY